MSKETMIILQVCFIILLLSYTSSHNIQGLMKELPNETVEKLFCNPKERELEATKTKYSS